MGYLNSLDYGIIIFYFAILLGLGLYLQRMASGSLEDYFLGGKKLPWWTLGIAGMTSWVDITGTMIITSFLYMMGPKGLYIEFRGGAGLALIFGMIWLGKWHRRSNCITGAEWMIYRFGRGFGGQFARISSAVGVIILMIGLMAYMVKGVGLFLSMFLPFEPLTCSLILIGVATTYTAISGFYGVVFTDLFQAAIIIIAVVIISVKAMIATSDMPSIAPLAEQITGAANWVNAWPGWKTTMPAGYEMYECLGMFALLYLAKTFIQGYSSGADPKYFGARDERECGKLSFLWGTMMMFRWWLMAGFVVLGLLMVQKLIPDNSATLQAAELIKQYVGEIEKARWPDELAGIINSPEKFAPELIAGLKSILGTEDWATKINLISYEGTVYSERILPAVLMHAIPMGVRGLLLIALISASMSTFDASVNFAAGYFTRDIYQGYIRKKASNREMIFASYAFIIVLVALGYGIGYKAKSINDIWGWITMGLVGGLMIPMTLRLYWWRFNGLGFAIGTVCGILGAVLQRAFYPDMVESTQLLLIVTVGLATSIIGTYMAPPTEKKVLEHFYRTTRPFGFWKPLERILPGRVYEEMRKEHRNDLMAIPFALGWQITILLLPMLLIFKNYQAFWCTFGIFIVCLIGMYKFWYKNLPLSEVGHYDPERIFKECESEERED